MQILTDFSKPYILDNLTAPMVITHCWIFAADMLDFTLAPITYLEETTGPAVKLRVEGTEFYVPASWNILVVDRETSTIDTIPIGSCSSTPFAVFLMSVDDSKLRIGSISVIDYEPNYSCIHPLITKGTALCHAIGPTKTIRGTMTELGCIIGPYDLNKFIAGKTAGDLLP